MHDDTLNEIRQLIARNPVETNHKLTSTELVALATLAQKQPATAIDFAYRIGKAHGYWTATEEMTTI